jgi:hypothetical protein
MKRIRKVFGIIAWLAAIMLLALACSNSLDSNAGYKGNLAKCQKNTEKEDEKIFKITFHDYLLLLDFRRLLLA